MSKLMKPIGLLACILLSAAPVQCGSPPAENAPPAKPLVVLVHAADCKVCAKVRPIFEELEKEYKDKATFVELDVTDNQKKSLARKTAKSMGVSSFLSFYEDSFPAFGVFNQRKKLQKELFGMNSKASYKAAIDKAIASSK